MEKGQKLEPIELRKFHQSGKSNYWRDVKRVALIPGKRMSKNGKVYYEYRKDRSDVDPETSRDYEKNTGFASL